MGGVALASAVAADFEERSALGAAGLGVLLATLVHKPADALTISTLMVRGGSARWVVHLVNLGFGLMIPAGVVLFVLGSAGIGAGAASSLTAGALRLLSRHVPLHRPLRPSSRAAVSLARPAQIVSRSAGRRGLDGHHGGVRPELIHSESIVVLKRRIDLD